jgi:(1->4)-alpha-D-glucan 1-alpha-D-glucosylmutase
MNETPDVFARLCAHYGIADHYLDISGRRHEVARENLIALLAEFGVDAATFESMSTALVAAETAAWGEVLPPVVVLDAEATHWTLRLRCARLPAQLPWTLTEEDGKVHEGVFDAAECQPIASHEIEGFCWHEYEIVFALALPVGYHRLNVSVPSAETLLVVAPSRCFMPSSLDDNGRIWGITLQLYSLRSQRNWGIGDFSDLAELASHWGALGVDIIGLNPLHALFPHNPAHVSPYSPSSRLGLNILYLDVEAIVDFHECETARQRVGSVEFQTRLRQLRAAEQVDYAGVAAAKLEILELLYAHFRELNPDQNICRADDFREFQAQGGETLRRHALFDALQAYFHAADSSVWGWPTWPEEFRDCTAPAVQRFAEEHRARVEWFEYLQWQAQRQLAKARARCRRAGMSVGLYLDLAVSVDRAGADAWMWARDFAPNASVGAPPDEFNQAGQNWGLPPLRPDRLRHSHYSILVETLRAAMRNAGALRIDHVMGLMRLFWIPRSRTAPEGAYVHYSLDAMLAIVALESWRSRCMVIGEDLGTVAEELRITLARYEILSYRLLYFERDAAGEFKRPDDYPRDALVAIGTHDLATLAGWWSDNDLRTRLALNLFPDASTYQEQLAERDRDRARLVHVLVDAGLLAPNEAEQASASRELTAALGAAAHAFIARAPSRVMMVQIEDAIGVAEQTNMPGTIDTHPNWRRKLPLLLEQLESGEPGERIAALAKVLAAARPRSARRQS